MRKGRNLKPAIVVLAAILVLFAATLNAAMVVGEPPGDPDPYKVNKFTDPIFSVDIILKDIAPLANLDLWQLGIQISPESGAVFSGLGAVNVSTFANYVFVGNSFDYGIKKISDYQITVGDLTVNAAGVTDISDKLLARLLFDVSGANVGDIFSLSLFGPGASSFFGDKDFNFNDEIMLAYQFQVVPIPGAVWLFGTGLVGLAALRRRLKK